jgi:hypothetical protein
MAFGKVVAVLDRQCHSKLVHWQKSNFTSPRLVSDRKSHYLMRLNIHKLITADHLQKWFLFSNASHMQANRHRSLIHMCSSSSLHIQASRARSYVYLRVLLNRAITSQP